MSRGHEAQKRIAERLNDTVRYAKQVSAPSFHDLAEAAGLDPACDFIGADLRGIDFRDEDLTAFDFSGADLSYSDFRRARVTSGSFEGATVVGTIGLVRQAVRATAEPLPLSEGNGASGSSDTLTDRTTLERHLAVIMGQVERSPESAEWKRELAETQYKLGRISINANDLTRAEQEFDLAISVLKDIPHDQYDSESERDLSLCYMALGDVFRLLGDIPRALRFFEQSFSILAAMVIRYPNLPALREDRATALARIEAAQLDGALAER